MLLSPLPTLPSHQHPLVPLVSTPHRGSLGHLLNSCESSQCCFSISINPLGTCGFAGIAMPSDSEAKCLIPTCSLCRYFQRAPAASYTLTLYKSFMCLLHPLGLRNCLSSKRGSLTDTVVQLDRVVQLSIEPRTDSTFAPDIAKTALASKEPDSTLAWLSHITATDSPT